MAGADKLLRLQHGITKQVKIVISKLNNKSHCAKKGEEDTKYLEDFGITREIIIKVSKLKLEANIHHSNSYSTFSESKSKSKSKKQIENKLPKKILLSCSHSGCNFQCRFRSRMEDHIVMHSTVRNYKCDLCEKTYKKQKELKLHLEKVHNFNFKQKKFSCSYPNCNYQGLSILARKNHLAKIHKEKPFQCNICSKTFGLNGGLTKHIITHSEDKQFKCDFQGCKYQCHFKESLHFHAATHLPKEEKPFRCEICHRSFSLRSNLKRHVLDLHKPELLKKEHKCPFCPYETQYKASFEKHMRVHTREKPFECKFCGYTASTQGYLRFHLRIHTGEKPYSCSTCKREFWDPGSFKRHKMIHTGEKPYSCLVCKKRFRLLGDMKNHLRVHSSEKPFSCEQCNFKTAQQSYLKSHIANIHDSENRVRSFQCPFCSKQFYHRLNLNEHIRTHTKEKPFKCNVCKKRYSSGSHFKVHQLSH